MKGTPSAPQCGFSRATVQILGVQGVDPKKFASYNVLEDPELRSGTSSPFLLDLVNVVLEKSLCFFITFP